MIKIPDGWKQCKLGKLFERRSEKGISGLPIISVTINNGIVLRDSLNRKMETNLNDEDHLLVKKNDIAYNMMRMWQGASGRADFDCIVSPAYIVLNPSEDIDPEYAAIWFKSARMIYLFWAYSYGLTNDRLRLYYKDLSMIPVFLPGLPKQKAIAEMISLWDEAIAKTQALIAAKEKQFKWLLKTLISDQVVKPGWKKVKLGDLFIERNEKNNSDLPLLSITRKDGLILQTQTNKKDNSNKDKSKYLRICPNDIGYNTMRMWQGISGVSQLYGIVSPAYTICIPNNKIFPTFIGYLFKTPLMIHNFYKYSQGLTSDTWNLKFHNFKEIETSIPSLDEQVEIACLLNDAKSELSIMQEILFDYEKQKRNLMKELFLGKWRIRN